jgi:hypothetical protein
MEKEGMTLKRISDGFFTKAFRWTWDAGTMAFKVCGLSLLAFLAAGVLHVVTGAPLFAALTIAFLRGAFVVGFSGLGVLSLNIVVRKLGERRAEVRKAVEEHTERCAAGDDARRKAVGRFFVRCVGRYDVTQSRARRYVVTPKRLNFHARNNARAHHRGRRPAFALAMSSGGGGSGNDCSDGSGSGDSSDSNQGDPTGPSTHATSTSIDTSQSNSPALPALLARALL